MLIAFIFSPKKLTLQKTTHGKKALAAIKYKLGGPQCWSGSGREEKHPASAKNRFRTPDHSQVIMLSQ
jgi:hypothetical protein